MLGLAPSRVRAYVRAGLLTAERGGDGRRRFSFQDLLLLRTAEGLVAERIPPRRVVRALKRLRAQLPDARPLTGVPLSADGANVVAHDGAARWQPDTGQVLLSFPGRGSAAADDRRAAAGCTPLVARPAASVDALASTVTVQTPPPADDAVTA